MEDLSGIFDTFAKRFAGKIRAKPDIVMPHFLKRPLNYSVASLEYVDDYVANLHKNFDRIPALAENKELENAMLWGGAYVGEVIRRNAKFKYRWIDYKDYVPLHPGIVSSLGPRQLGTCAFLYDAEAECMCMPVNKMLRCYYEGPSNDVSSFASEFLD